MMRSSIKMNCPACANSILQPFVEPCCNCNDGSEFKPKTNADRIRAKTDDELAEWFAEHEAMLIANVLNDDYVVPTKSGWLDWLKQESTE